MKRTLILSAAAIMFAACCSQPKFDGPVYLNPNAPVEERVEDALARMTLEEKVGQMTQLNATVIADGTDITPKGDSLLRYHKVGSVLNAPGDCAQTPEDYCRFVSEINVISLEACGIPTLYGLDHIHGTSYIAGGILFPQEVNIAATFNREHAYNMGKVAAYESRAANVPWTFSPTMDLGRNPSWSRMWESFGEDVYVNAEMAVAEVRGMQGDDPNNVGPYHIAACAKHFAVHSGPEATRHGFDAIASLKDMYETYLPAFEKTVKSGVAGVMGAYNRTNGEAC